MGSPDDDRSGTRALLERGVAAGVISAAQRDALLARIPLGRLGAPDDVAAAVVFLAGPGGAYITGTTLHVNGGMLMP